MCCRRCRHAISCSGPSTWCSLSGRSRSSSSARAGLACSKVSSGPEPSSAWWWPRLWCEGSDSVRRWLALAAAFTIGVAIVVLPLLGMSLSLLDNLSRMLLQRSAEPASLGAVFSLAGLVAGLGQLGGSAIAQAVIAVASVEVALVVLAMAMMLILVLAWRSLRHADNEAAVPVVEMALLRGLPMFSPMPALDLEVVSRLAQHVDVAAGDTVIVQGDPGEVFYAVVSGSFDVVMSGEFVRSVTRGGWFGEVALLSDRPRTASVIATSAGSLLAIEREPFLTAVSGDQASMSAALAVVERLDFDEA